MVYGVPDGYDSIPSPSPRWLLVAGLAVPRKIEVSKWASVQMEYPEFDPLGVDFFTFRRAGLL
jgi:hypothetical protein